MLIQIGGLNVLTDPVWADRASPLPFPGPRRRLPPAVALDGAAADRRRASSRTITTITSISAAVRRLAAEPFGDGVARTVGVGHHIRDAGRNDVHEHAMVGEAIMSGALSFMCTPGAALERSRHLRSESIALVRMGDDREIRAAARSLLRRRHGILPGVRRDRRAARTLRVCLLPIGAYEPRWYMRYVHMTPEEAVRAYEELCRGKPSASSFVPIHWGTFRIADEPLDEPPRRLRAEWSAAGVSDRARSRCWRTARRGVGRPYAS